MNFDSRIYSYYHEIKELNKGRFPYPRFLALYPTNTCQFNCMFCDYKALNSRKARHLKVDEWKYILDTFKNNGGEGVGLSGGGEPLMLESITELLFYIKKLGLSVNLITNGLNIDKKRKPKLYDALMETCSFIRVSFEAGSPEVFNKIKGKNYFNRIIGNVTEFIKDKPKDLQVSYKYTIPSSYSIEDIENAICIADDVGFYSIQFKAVCNAENKLTEPDKKALKEYISTISANTTNVICDLNTYVKEDDGCLISAIQTLIDCNGDVYICCYYTHRIKEHRIGNVFETKFEDIWGTWKHIKKIVEVDCSKCNLYDCRYIRYAHIMEEKINNNYFSFI